MNLQCHTSRCSFTVMTSVLLGRKHRPNYCGSPPAVRATINFNTIVHLTSGITTSHRTSGTTILYSSPWLKNRKFCCEETAKVCCLLIWLHGTTRVSGGFNRRCRPQNLLCINLQTIHMLDDTERAIMEPEALECSGRRVIQVPD